MDHREIFEEGFAAGKELRPSASESSMFPAAAWMESEAKMEADRRASMLALLEEPTSGLRVVGEGFVWEYRREAWVLETADIISSFYATSARPLLKALVSCGAAYVEGGGKDA